MHPMLVREPCHREGWVYEEKNDSWRTSKYGCPATTAITPRASQSPTPLLRRWGAF